LTLRASVSRVVAEPAASLSTSALFVRKPIEAVHGNPENTDAVLSPHDEEPEVAFAVSPDVDEDRPAVMVARARADHPLRWP
jgi:hypothetical protein